MALSLRPPSLFLRFVCYLRHACSYSLFRRPTFQRLVDALYGSTKGQQTFGLGFDPCKRVPLTLYRLSQGATVRSTGDIFEISEGSVTEITFSAVELVLSHLEEEFIQRPTIPKQEAMSRRWELKKILR